MTSGHKHILYTGIPTESMPILCNVCFLQHLIELLMMLFTMQFCSSLPSEVSFGACHIQFNLPLRFCSSSFCNDPWLLVINRSCILAFPLSQCPSFTMFVFCNISSNCWWCFLPCNSAAVCQVKYHLGPAIHSSIFRYVCRVNEAAAWNERPHWWDLKELKCHPSVSQTLIILTLKVLNFWKLTSYCSLKPLWSGMGVVVPARTSPTLHPPSPPTVHQLSWLAL